MSWGRPFEGLAGTGLLDANDVFEEAYMGQESGDGHILGQEAGYPFIYSRVYKTDTGYSYLRSPGLHLIGKTESNLDSIETFLSGFDAELEFDSYLQDPVKLKGGTGLIKFAGQACYASFGPKRTTNKDASKYMTHIKESGHGSVTAHANYNFFAYGLSRSLTHELVRHGIGTAYSQLSQRFVSGRVLRFVERPEYQTDPELHDMFCARIERDAVEYDLVAQKLYQRQASGDTTLSAERKTDLRKKVQQAARSVLPNETETFLVFSANVRALRHMCEMRAAAGAEIEIRDLFVKVFKLMREVEPILFEDYTVVQLLDGTEAVETPYRKV